MGRRRSYQLFRWLVLIDAPCNELYILLFFIFCCSYQSENFGILESSFSNKSVNLANTMAPCLVSIRPLAVCSRSLSSLLLLLPLVSGAAYEEAPSRLLKRDGAKKLRNSKSQNTFMSPTSVSTADTPRKLILFVKHIKGVLNSIISRVISMKELVVR